MSKILAEYSVIGVLFLVTMMLIIPLPLLVTDIFVFFSISFSILTLMVAVYVGHVVAFSSFPAILLVLSIFRISLSVATTRNILVEGESGDIITAFGEFAISGNVIVGVVIFLLITIVQFVVINKGSERVAEVSARFTLDALPGKQMSIDSEQRAGAIDSFEARRLRSRLQQESQFHGAMDGCMKFLKGDAIAGLLMVFVNFLGGIFVGMVQRGMDFGNAIEVYTILTIGDGLVGQIPGIFTAVAAGILVTRVSEDDNSENAEVSGLAQNVVGQFSGQPEALLAGGLLTVVMAFFPGFPTVVCLSFALLAFVAYFFARRQRNRLRTESVIAEYRRRTWTGQPVRVAVDTPLIAGMSADAFEALLNKTLDDLSEEMGVPFPPARVDVSKQLGLNQYMVSVDGIPKSGAILEPNKLIAGNAKLMLEIYGFEYTTLEIRGDREIFYVFDEAAKGYLTALGCRIFTPAEFIAFHLRRIMLVEMKTYVDVDFTRNLLSRFVKQAPEAGQELQGLIKPVEMTDVFKLLAEDQVPLLAVRTIFTAMLDAARREREIFAVARAIRHALADQLTLDMVCSDGRLYAMQLSPPATAALAELVQRGKSGEYFDLNVEDAQRLVGMISQSLDRWELEPGKLFLLVPNEIRFAMRRLLLRTHPHLRVIAVDEMRADLQVVIFDVIHPAPDGADVAPAPVRHANAPRQPQNVQTTVST